MIPSAGWRGHGRLGKIGVMGSGLETDLYELTMAAGYWRAGMTGNATFELFVRHLPANRSYLIVAGLEQALEYLERVSFDTTDRDWLRRRRQFKDVPAAFFDDYLAGFRFTGDVWAMAEGSLAFSNEPILRVTAPLPEAQIVETALLAIVSFQTSVASKAARLVIAGSGRSIVEFGARRGHGLAAAIDAARAAYIGGCTGTSFVEAARRFDIPAFGTMAHSWVQAFPSEVDAFLEFARTFADSAVYLLDTYDTLSAARRLAASGLRPPVVRLDSGDLVALSRGVRSVLDDAGLTDTRIFASGDLDEYAIARLIEARAPIDGFGVGTALTTLSDAPALPAVYKLVEIDRGGEHVGVVKLSPGKETWPGTKQVWRIVENGRLVKDVIAAADEAGPANAASVLTPVMARGLRIGPPETLAAIRDRCRRAIASLPEPLKQLDETADEPVTISERLEARRSALGST